jgi:acyl-CoA synthetase (AMP-forming)/AMP-acid ligase II
MAGLFPQGLKQASVVAVLGCFIAGAVAAMASPGAGSDQAVSVAVNRINKGDRLPTAAKVTVHLNNSSSATKLSAPPKGPPLGCDPLFSSITDPAKARLYYRRCTV